MMMKWIGSRRELLVDDWLLAKMDNTVLRLHSPVPKEIALEPETTYSYVTVFPDQDRCRMYYRRGEGPSYDIRTLTPETYRDTAKNRPELTAYAESPDGIHWEKPNLGLIAFQGSTENNVVWYTDSELSKTAHNFTPFKDQNPGAKPKERYKALAGTGKTGGLLAFASPDAIHWRTMQLEPVITAGKFDSQNLAFWDTVRGQYVALVRDKDPASGVRSLRRCTSQDFLHWSTPEWVSYGDAPHEHLYTSAATPYFRAPHMYVAFPRRFIPERKYFADSPINGLSDQVFMSSRDGGLTWDRRFLEAFVRPGLDEENWTDRSGTIAYGLIPTSDRELSLYWTEHSKQPSCRVRRATLRMDGFVSAYAPYAGGELVTDPFVFSGSQLYLNYSTSGIGGIQVELQNAEGEPIAGHELTEPIYGDKIDGRITWPGQNDLSALAGRPVRLRLVLKDADVYSLQFRED